MSDFDQTDTGNVKGRLDTVLPLTPPVSVRVSPHSYFSALLLCSFFSAFLFYMELDLAGVILFAVSWILLPFFALGDKISFDGKRLLRTGIVPQMWSW